MTYEEFEKLRNKAENNTEKSLTEKELNEIKPYKVDNAIIMAAGYVCHYLIFFLKACFELRVKSLLREKYDSYRKLELKKL